MHSKPDIAEPTNSLGIIRNALLDFYRYDAVPEMLISEVFELTKQSTLTLNRYANFDKLAKALDTHYGHNSTEAAVNIFEKLARKHEINPESIDSNLVVSGREALPTGWLQESILLLRTKEERREKADLVKRVFHKNYPYFSIKDSVTDSILNVLDEDPGDKPYYAYNKIARILKKEYGYGFYPVTFEILRAFHRTHEVDPKLDADRSFYREKDLASDLASQANRTVWLEKDNFIESVFQSKEYTFGVKARFADFMLDEFSARKWAYQYYGGLKLNYLVGRVHLIPELVVYAARNKNWELGTLNALISETSLLRHSTDKTKAETTFRSVNAFLAKAPASFHEKFHAFLMSRVEVEHLDISPVYPHVRKLYELDADIPDSWVHKIVTAQLENK